MCQALSLALKKKKVSILFLPRSAEEVLMMVLLPMRELRHLDEGPLGQVHTETLLRVNSTGLQAGS